MKAYAFQEAQQPVTSQLHLDCWRKHPCAAEISHVTPYSWRKYVSCEKEPASPRIEDVFWNAAYNAPLEAVMQRIYISFSILSCKKFLPRMPLSCCTSHRVCFQGSWELWLSHLEQKRASVTKQVTVFLHNPCLLHPWWQLRTSKCFCLWLWCFTSYCQPHEERGLLRKKELEQRGKI